MPLTQSSLPIKVFVLKKTHSPGLHLSISHLSPEFLRRIPARTLGFDRSSTLEPTQILLSTSLRRLDTTLNLIASAVVLWLGFDLAHSPFDHLTCALCTNKNSDS